MAVYTPLDIFTLQLILLVLLYHGQGLKIDSLHGVIRIYFANFTLFLIIGIKCF